MSEILTRLIVIRLRGAWALIKHEGGDSAVVSLVWIHRVGKDSVRSTLAKEVITVFYLLSAEDLLIRKEDASITRVRKEDTSKGRRNLPREPETPGCRAPSPRTTLPSRLGAWQ